MADETSLQCRPIAPPTSGLAKAIASVWAARLRQPGPPVSHIQSCPKRLAPMSPEISPATQHGLHRLPSRGNLPTATTGS